MNKFTFQIFAIVFITITFSGCAFRSKTPSDIRGEKTPVQRIQGHWVLGICYSFFVLQDDSESYWVVDLPDEASEMMRIQPSHTDMWNRGRQCRAIYLDVLGSVVKDEHPDPKGYMWLKIEKVFEMRPANTNFFKSKSHPTPQKDDSNEPIAQHMYIPAIQ